MVTEGSLLLGGAICPVPVEVNEMVRIEQPATHLPPCGALLSAETAEICSDQTCSCCIMVVHR